MGGGHGGRVLEKGLWGRGGSQDGGVAIGVGMVVGCCRRGWEEGDGGEDGGVEMMGTRRCLQCLKEELSFRKLLTTHSAVEGSNFALSFNFLSLVNISYKHRNSCAGWGIVLTK
ncbi:hypothetical protein BaRGS_00030784, partial [Batillaria attramentaria]